MSREPAGNFTRRNFLLGLLLLFGALSQTPNLTAVNANMDTTTQDGQQRRHHGALRSGSETLECLDREGFRRAS